MTASPWGMPTSPRCTETFGPLASSSSLDADGFRRHCSRVPPPGLLLRPLSALEPGGGGGRDPGGAAPSLAPPGRRGRGAPRLLAAAGDPQRVLRPAAAPPGGRHAGWDGDEPRRRG